MKSKKITLKYIAEQTGVSIATVSRVINGNDIVEQDAKEKVLKILKNLDYKKNKKKPKNIISLIIPDISNPFFASIVSSVQQTSSLYGYHVIVSECKDNEILSNEYLKEVSDIGVLGSIIIPSRGTDKHLLNIVNNSSIPVVFADRKIEADNINYVGADNITGSYNATKYLISLGHTKIIYMSGPKEVSTEKERYIGFLNAIKEHKINFDEELMYAHGNYDFNESYREIKRIINSKIKFTAVFSASDSMCFAIKQALEESSMSIPNDISLMGYDNIAFSTSIGLTTVNTPVSEMAKNAVLLLLDILNKRITSPSSIILQPNIVIRSSCKKI